MNDHASPSSDAIAAAFPHTVLERINGTPGREDIDDAQEKQTENAASRPSTRGGGNHGHAGMVVPPGRYVVEFSPVAYVWELNPGEAPVYPDAVAAAPARILDNNFARAQRIFREQSGTETSPCCPLFWLMSIPSTICLPFSNCSEQARFNLEI